MDRKHSFFYLRPGSVVRGTRDNYTVVAELGESSANAIVYKAEVHRDHAEQTADSAPNYVCLKLGRVPLLDDSETRIRNLTEVKDSIAYLELSFEEERAISKLVPHDPALISIVDDGHVEVDDLEVSNVEVDGKSPRVKLRTSRIPFIVSEWVDGFDLKEVLGTSDFSTLTVQQRVSIAKDIARALMSLHQGGVVHNDLHPANIRLATVNEKVRPVILDFGYSVRRGSGRWRPVEKWMASADPDYAGTVLGDVYSFGIVLISLLTNSYPSEHVQGRENVNRYIDARAAELLSNWPMLREVCIKCVSRNISTRYKSVDHILQDIRVAERVTGAESDKLTDDLMSTISESYKGLQRRAGNVFEELAYYKFKQLADLLGEMSSRCCDMYGGREELLGYHLRFLAPLRSGDAYDTLSDIENWSEQNLGCPGRLLSTNAQLMRNGVKIKRILYARKTLLKYEEYRALTVHVLRHHEALREELEADGICYDVRFTVYKDESEANNIREKGDRFGIIRWHEDDREEVVYLCQLIGTRPPRTGFPVSSVSADFAPFKLLGMQMFFLNLSERNDEDLEVLTRRFEETEALLKRIEEGTTSSYRSCLSLRRALAMFDELEDDPSENLWRGYVQ